MRRGRAEDFVLYVREGKIVIKQFSWRQGKWNEGEAGNNGMKATQDGEWTMEAKNELLHYNSQSDDKVKGIIKEGSEEGMEEHQADSSNVCQAGMGDDMRSNICQVDSEDFLEPWQLESDDEQEVETDE